MRIAVYGTDEQKKEFAGKGVPGDIEIKWLDRLQSMGDAEACFDLLFNETTRESNIYVEGIPVFVNAVLLTGRQLPGNYIRFNGWPGFLEREIIEVAAADHHSKKNAEGVLKKLGWKFAWTPDEPGMIAARIIAMVINEAYIALEEKVSTRDEIDTAMKLGTNYPYGPFEWSSMIGLNKIYYLLKALKEKEGRYEISRLLIKEASFDKKT